MGPVPEGTGRGAEERVDHSAGTSRFATKQIMVTVFSRLFNTFFLFVSRLFYYIFLQFCRTAAAVRVCVSVWSCPCVVPGVRCTKTGITSIKNGALGLFNPPTQNWRFSREIAEIPKRWYFFLFIIVCLCDKINLQNKRRPCKLGSSWHARLIECLWSSG